MKYRAELDGLRAIAVLAVLIFHISSEQLSGGFLGVDVFFVLSGFLITSILDEHSKQGVSLKHFWMKRIRRILPALAGTVAFTLFCGSALFLYHDRSLLLEHAAAALLSLSNFFILEQTSGYWAVSSSTLPLLHTWSLSLEEQFYFIFPLMLSVLGKYNRKVVLVALSLFALCSLFGPMLVRSDPSSVFLMLPFRAWEMLLGAILAISRIEGFLPSPKSMVLHTSIQIVAFAALIYSFVSIEVFVIFDPAAPILSCVSTAVLIYSFGCAKTFVHQVLSSPIMVFIGKRSYSIYLYHWPILVFLKLYDPDPNPLIVLAMTFFCAEVSYQWIEKPFRYQPQPFRRIRNWVTISLLPCAFIAVAAFSHPFAVSNDLRSLSLSETYFRGAQYDLEEVKNGVISDPPSWNWQATDRPDVLLVGSSHALSLVEALSEFCLQNDQSLVSLARSFEGIIGDTETNRARLNFAKKVSPRTVIIFSHLSDEMDNLSLEDYIAVLEEWSAVSDRLIVIDSPPELIIPDRIAPSIQHYLVHLDLSGRALDIRVKERDTSVLEEATKAFPKITWVDITPLFSENLVCKFLPDGAFPYADQSHLNPLGSRFLLYNKLDKLLLEKTRKAEALKIGSSHDLE